jgi:uncharacterized protein (DUF58 family)
MALRSLHRLRLESRRKLYSPLLGSHPVAADGGGAEFREIREYTPGDNIRHLNPHASARLGRPVVNRFEDSRRLDARLLYLAGGTMAYGHPRSKHEVAVELLTLLALTARRNGDRIEALLYDDETPLWVGSPRMRHLPESLYHEAAGRALPGKRVTPDRCLATLQSRLRKRSLLFLLGDFLEPWDLTALAERHELRLLILRDRREERPGFDRPGLFLDPVTLRQVELEPDRGAMKRYEEAMSLRDAALEGQLRKLGILFRKVYTDEDPLDALVSFLRKGRG